MTSLRWELFDRAVQSAQSQPTPTRFLLSEATSEPSSPLPTEAVSPADLGLLLPAHHHLSANLKSSTRLQEEPLSSTQLQSAIPMPTPMFPQLLFRLPLWFLLLLLFPRQFPQFLPEPIQPPLLLVASTSPTLIGLATDVPAESATGWKQAVANASRSPSLLLSQ